MATETKPRTRSIVYRSRFTPGADGSEIAFEIGEIAILWPGVDSPATPDDAARCRGKRVVILSSHTYNRHTPEGLFDREVVFENAEDQAAFGYAPNERFLVRESSLRALNPVEYRRDRVAEVV